MAENNRNYVVYRWRNKLNGKCYVGITSDPEARKRQHIQGYNPGSWITQAIGKHGLDNFDYDELATDLTQDEALKQEQHFIIENDAFGKGYNQTPGGYHITGPKSGEEHHNSILTEEQVMAIIHDPCSETKAEKKYGVSRATIYHIRNGSTWSHLDRSNAPQYENDRTKITSDIARSIFLDPRRQQDIVREYGIDQSTVSNIKTRRNWKKATAGLIKPVKDKTENIKPAFYVFRLLNTVNDKVMVGISKEPKKRMSQLLSGHGSKLIAADVKEHGRQAFLRQIVSEFETEEEAFRSMQSLILRQNALYPNGYNLTIGGKGSHGHMWNMDQRDSIRGSKNGRSKLTEVDVVSIFYDPRSKTAISKAYGISTTMVTKIKRKQAWKHVTENLD